MPFPLFLRRVFDNSREKTREGDQRGREHHTLSIGLSKIAEKGHRPPKRDIPTKEENLQLMYGKVKQICGPKHLIFHNGHYKKNEVFFFFSNSK